MDHHRPVIRSVCAGVLQIESLRKIEIGLNRRELPISPDRIFHVDVELRSVKSAAALFDLVGKADIVASPLDRVRRTLPNLRFADRLVRPRPDGESILLEFERVENGE